MTHGAVVSLIILAASVAGGVDRYADLCREAAALGVEGQYKGAIQKYQEALKVRPNAPEAWNNLAVMYYQEKLYPEAFAAASKVWAAHPELRSAALIAGMAAVQCNRPADAILPLEKLLAADPLNRDAVLALTSAYFGLNDFSKAAAIYEKWTARAANDADAWYGLAICDEQMAERTSRELSKTPGGAPYSKRLVAEFLRSQGDEKLAAEAFGEAQAKEEVGISGSPAAGKLYSAARDLAARSRHAFEQFVNLAPDSWQAALFLGDVDRQHGDLESALTRYKRAEELRPDIPAPLLGMGTVYWELGDFPQATAYLNKTLGMNPNATQAIFELGNIAVRLHHDGEAVPLLLQYLNAQPDAAAARADLGRAYMHLGKYDEAARELKMAASSDEHGEIHYELSVALRKLGRNSAAEAALETSKQIKAGELERQQRLHQTAH